MISRKPTHPGVVLLEDVIKPLGAYHHRCSQDAWCKPESIIRICK